MVTKVVSCAEHELRLNALEEQLALALRRIEELEAKQRLSFGAGASRLNSEGYIIPANYPPR